MIYILYYKWKSTSGNHAGMEYLAKYLKKHNAEVKLIEHVPQDYKGGRYIGAIHAWLISIFLFFKLKKSDKLFFMDYMGGSFIHQEKIAARLRLWNKKQQFVALIHLAGNHLKEFYPTNEIILEKLELVNKVVVFGSSLNLFLKSTGFSGKIITSYHYVDTDYYKPSNLNTNVDSLNVIFMGSLKRNFLQLKEIIAQSNPNINFHICFGRYTVDDEFKRLPNVKLYGYLPEDQLLALMQKCQVSLSVLEDTIGSNAITTAMATGLIQVVSDVGSIKDYCDSNNSFLCNTTADFIAALNTLNTNPQILKDMQLNSRNRATELSIQSYITEFASFFKS